MNPFIQKSSQLFRKGVLSGLIFFLFIAGVSCGNSSLNKDAADEDSYVNTAPKLTQFERDLKSLKTADFKYIYVFRRKDGGTFDEDDKRILRENSPREINRYVSTDEEKAFIAGSNFMFPEENLNNLKERFEVEDLSPPAAQIQNEKKQESNTNETENVNAQSDQANKKEGK